MKPQNDKIFTANDIMRYHSGKMPEREMHAMEKAALEDPFLADALEGYLHTTTPNQDLADIRQRLFEKKRTPVIPISGSYGMWLKIAAVLILIIGGGYLTYYFNSNKQEHTLARNQDTTRTDNRSFTKQADTNKVIAKANNDLAEADNKIKSKGSQSKITKSNTSTLKVSSDSLKQNDLASGNDIVKNNNLNSAPSAQEKELSDKTADVATKPVTYANNDNKNRVKTTDTVGNGRFKKGDTAVVTIASVGYETRRPKLKKAAVLQPKAKYKEIVAANNYKKDKANEDDSVLILKRAGKRAEDDLPRVIGIDSSFQPLKGWMDYDQYLADNSDLFNKCKGQMVLSFITNKKGYPIKINVERSLSLDCDDKAIKLLRDGPKWISVPNKRCNITLQF
jgi:hypothetical protein